MGAIKDVVDLAKELEGRVKERRDLELVHKIQSLILSVQSEHVDVVERDITLMRENDDLKRKLAELESEEILIKQCIEFRRGKRTQGEWLPFCPKCHMPALFTSEAKFSGCSDSDCKWEVETQTPVGQLIQSLPAGPVKTS